MNENNFRKQLINIMCDSEILKSNNLGDGYVDWHNGYGECGVTFILATGEKFSLIIKQDK